jgi:hypothetical protein
MDVDSDLRMKLRVSTLQPDFRPLKIAEWRSYVYGAWGKQ